MDMDDFDEEERQRERRGNAGAGSFRLPTAAREAQRSPRHSGRSHLGGVPDLNLDVNNPFSYDDEEGRMLLQHDQEVLREVMHERTQRQNAPAGGRRRNTGAVRRQQGVRPSAASPVSRRSSTRTRQPRSSPAASNEGDAGIEESSHGDAASHVSRASGSALSEAGGTEASVFDEEMMLDDDEEESSDEGVQSDPNNAADLMEFVYGPEQKRRERRRARRQTTDAVYRRVLNDPQLRRVMDERIQTIANDDQPGVPESRSRRRIRDILQQPLTLADAEAAVELDTEGFFYIPVPLTYQQHLNEVFDPRYDVRSECFACNVGLHSEAAQSSAIVQRLLDFWRMHHGRIEEDILIEAMARIFETERQKYNEDLRTDLRVYNPCVTEEEIAREELRPWPARSIYFHFARHMRTPEMELYRMFTELSNVREELSRTLKRVHPQMPHMAYFNYRTMALYLAIMERQMRLIRIDPTKVPLASHTIDPLATAFSIPGSGVTTGPRGPTVSANIFTQR